MAEGAAQDVRAVPGGREPGCDDCARRGPSPASGVEVLAEPRVAVTGRTDRRGRGDAARRVTQLLAGRDPLSLQDSGMPKPRPGRERTAIRSAPSPVDEAHDRFPLDCRGRRGVIGTPTPTSGSEVHAPRSRGAVRRGRPYDGREPDEKRRKAQPHESQANERQPDECQPDERRQQERRPDPQWTTPPGAVSARVPEVPEPSVPSSYDRFPARSLPPPAPSAGVLTPGSGIT